MSMTKFYKATTADGKVIKGTISQLSKLLYVSITTVINRYKRPDHFDDFKVELIGQVETEKIMTRHKKIYHVTPLGRTKPCFSGTSNEVAERYGVSREHIYKCANSDIKFQRDYIITKEK